MAGPTTIERTRLLLPLEHLPAGAVCLADHASVVAHPGLAERFEHVFLLDPPCSSEQREAVILKIYQGFKFEEMADILGCPVSTVRMMDMTS